MTYFIYWVSIEVLFEKEGLKRASLLKNNNNKYLKATALVGNSPFNPAEKTGTCAKLHGSKVCKPFRGRRLAMSHRHRYSASVGVEKRSLLAGVQNLALQRGGWAFLQGEGCGRRRRGEGERLTLVG